MPDFSTARKPAPPVTASPSNRRRSPERSCGPTPACISSRKTCAPGPITSPSSTTEDYGYLQQTFELDGKRGKRIAFAASGVERTEAERTLALRQIAAGIADAYWAAAAAREALHEWQRELGDYDRLVDYQKNRVDSGATAGVDLLRTEVERDRAALSYGQAERDAEDAALTLARLTASPGFRTAALTDSLEGERTVPEMVLPAAVEQRPDVIAGRAAVRESDAGLRLQRSYGVSNIDFLGGYKRNSGFNTAYGALQYDLPFFNRNQGGVATAAAQRQLAEDQLAYTRLQASAEIQIALNDYRREQTAVHTVLPPTVERAGRNAQILTEAYRSGGADLLRLLDAQRAFIDTRLLAIQTWTRYQRAVIALRLAYGEEP